MTGQGDGFLVTAADGGRGMGRGNLMAGQSRQLQC